MLSDTDGGLGNPLPRPTSTTASSSTYAHTTARDSGYRLVGDEEGTVLVSSAAT